MMRSIAMCSVVMAVCASGASAAERTVGDPRLNGFWAVDDAARRASTQANRPELTPAAQATQERDAAVQRARTERGDVVGLGSLTCTNNPLPFMYTASEPILIVATPDAVALITERLPMNFRHFHTDGRAMPDVTRMPKNSNGYSVARWEGRDLLVETRGMTPSSVRTPNAVLEERFSVSPDGQRLTVGITFTDPASYVKPYSYQIFYDRLPADTYALTQYCDSAEDSGALVLEPPQE